MPRPPRTDDLAKLTVRFSAEGRRLLAALARHLSRREGPTSQGQALERAVRVLARQEGMR
jgi:hypothetical protein